MPRPRLVTFLFLSNAMLQQASDTGWTICNDTGLSIISQRGCSMPFDNNFTSNASLRRKTVNRLCLSQKPHPKDHIQRSVRDQEAGLLGKHLREIVAKQGSESWQSFAAIPRTHGSESAASAGSQGHHALTMTSALGLHNMAGCLSAQTRLLQDDCSADAASPLPPRKA